MTNRRNITPILLSAFILALPAWSAPSDVNPCPSEAEKGANRSTVVAFGPEENPEALILRLIDSARTSIHLSAFSFSSAPIIEALIRAHQRGVDVAVVVDRKHNVDDDTKGIGQRALAQLVRSDIAVRTNANYRIHHDKFMVVDDRHVETGSYNFSPSANKNSENVLIICNSPQLAARYVDHWGKRFAEAADFRDARK